MVKCSNCNKTFDNTFDFCPYCGKKAHDQKMCPNCKVIKHSYAVYN